MTTEALPVPKVTHHHRRHWFRGLRGLWFAETRRWFPVRSLALALLGVALVAGGWSLWQVDHKLSNAWFPFHTFWAVALTLTTVAATQALMAGEIDSGTAGWLVSKPIGRPAVVVGKFAGAVLPVAALVVAVPGIVAYQVFGRLADRGIDEFSAFAVTDLTQGDINRDTWTTLPSAGRYAGALVLLGLFVLFTVATMILLGIVVRSRAAVFLLGLAVAGGLFAAGNLAPDEIAQLTPGWGMESLYDAVRDRAAPVLGPAVVTTVWILGVLLAASWSFQRKEL